MPMSKRQRLPVRCATRWRTRRLISSGLRLTRTPDRAEFCAPLTKSRTTALHRVTHLPRPNFVAALRHAEALVGNSSAGIIEAASFGTPVVNIGNRQRARERNRNTIDCPGDRRSIAAAVTRALAHGRYPAGNVYGDGQAGARITHLLATLPMAADLLDKVNSY